MSSNLYQGDAQMIPTTTVETASRVVVLFPAVSSDSEFKMFLSRDFGVQRTDLLAFQCLPQEWQQESQGIGFETA